ncbi:PKD domain-containing protein, partial [bacterium]|nr:PKD domain-containing protein [bacterium]
YVAGGVYKVQLRVTDTVNNSDMLDIPLTIVVNSYDNQPPTAAAHADTYDIDINEVVSFFDDSFDPDGYSDIVMWEWDFSFDPVDGFNPGSYIPNPQVQYTYEGTYMVQLRVTDSIGNFDILDYPLVITVHGPNPNDPPLACGYVLNNHPNVGTLVQFYDCSYDPDGMMDIITFEWDLDGDGIFETVAKNPAHVYYSGGDIYVQHRVTDSTGNSDILDIPIFVEVNAPPVAQAVADKTVVDVGEDITLTNLSIDPDGNGPIVEVLWDLNGNGLYYDPEDVQNQDQVIVNFDSPGLYNIGLKVIDAYGLSDELDVMLQINVGNYPNQDPVAVASVNKNWAWTGQQLIFKGHQSYDPDGYIVSWDWDFDGDGIFGDPYVGGSESKPHVVYDEPGEYLVNLRVTDNDGATDTLDILIPISIFNHPGEGESGGFDD